MSKALYVMRQGEQRKRYIGARNESGSARRRCFRRRAVHHSLTLTVLCSGCRFEVERAGQVEGGFVQGSGFGFPGRGEAEPENLSRLQQAADEAGAIVINQAMTREESYALMNNCDCYVSLHRSEGFGFTMAEAMLMGKPVIGTAYSGNLDFMTPDNSLLVD